jgi:hypothetical protein
VDTRKSLFNLENAVESGAVAAVVDGKSLEDCFSIFPSSLLRLFGEFEEHPVCNKLN